MFLHVFQQNFIFSTVYTGVDVDRHSITITHSKHSGSQLRQLTLFLLLVCGVDVVAANTVATTTAWHFIPFRNYILKWICCCLAAGFGF